MKDLSPEKIQRINAKVAELCGKHPCHQNGWAPFNSQSLIKTCNCVDCYPIGRPDNYWQSLDACAKMESFCDIGDFKDGDHPRYAYARELYPVVPRDRQPFRATAPQRVTAFLAIHNLTIEEI